MVNEKGIGAAIAEINKKDGKFVWADTYVFLMDLDGKMLAHPMSPALIGKNGRNPRGRCGGDPVKTLRRKLLRELWGMKGQALAIAMVIVSGVAT